MIIIKPMLWVGIAIWLVGLVGFIICKKKGW